MPQWVPVQTGQPHDTHDYFSREQTYCSHTAWNGIELQEVKLPPAELPEGYAPRHVLYLHLSEPVRTERYVCGEGWRAETLRAGHIYFFPAAVPLAARWPSPVTCLELFIEPDFVSRTFERDRLQPTPAGAENDPLILQLMYALRRDLREGSPRGRLYGECLGTALVAHLVRYYSPFEEGTRILRGTLPRNRLKRVLELINDRLEEDLSLSDLAKVVGLNPDYFSRAFKQTTGLSPYRYVLLERIERACSLLRDPRTSISEITARCGFASQSSFTTAFRRIKGITPSAYRREVL